MSQFAAASALVIEAAIIFIIAVALTAIVTALIVVVAEIVTDLVERWLAGPSDGGGS